MLLALLLVMPAAQALACSVYIPRSQQHLHTTKAYFKRADGVLVVQVEDVRDGEKSESGTRQIIRFRKLDEYKGARADVFDVDVGIPWSCGPDYKVGEQYIVYFEHDKTLGERIFEARGPFAPDAEGFRAARAELQQLSN